MTNALPGIALPVITDAAFEKFRALIFEKTGIHMRDGKQILISNRLRKRLAALRLSSYEEYYDLLVSGKAPEELHNFVDAVSTNETYFFREMNHFTVLRNAVLPDLLSRRKRLAVWSAGCSTGEEPYTLRIVMDDHFTAVGEGEATIVGTDISTNVITRARQGIYNERALRFVPPLALQKYFGPERDGLRQASPALRAAVTFTVHNLFKDPPPGEAFDIIFCRNVMIYFDKPTQAKLVDEIFTRALRPDGYLFIGHSESLSGFSRRFRYASALRAPIYRMKKEGET